MFHDSFSYVTRTRRALLKTGSAFILNTLPNTGSNSPASTQKVTSKTSEVFNPLHLGAKGNGRTKDTHFLQLAIDQCAAAGGGVVLLEPHHTFLSGALTLRSHVNLHISGGAVLLASPDRSDYHAVGSLLFAKGSEDIHVSGTGVIDGNSKAFFPPKGPDGYPVPQPFLGPYDPLYAPSNMNPRDGRPRMILLVDCRHTLLEQFTIRDSPTWTVHPIGCEHLRITGISILNDLDVPNCDGIDIDHCRKVIIDNCNIVAGDDCLVLKASRNFGDFGPCEEIAISNCTLESSSAGIKIETEGPFPLRSVVIKGCTIVRSNRGVSFLNRDGATVQDMLFSDLVIETRMRSMMWWGSGEAIAMSSVPRQQGGEPGLVKNIAFVNMLCRGESGVYLRGANGAPLKDITFRGIDLIVEKTTHYPGGFYDMRPGDMFGNSGLDRRSTAGFFAANVDGLSLSNFCVSWATGAPTYYGAAVELHDCSRTLLSQITGSAAHPDQPSAVLENVSYAPTISFPVSATSVR